MELYRRALLLGYTVVSLAMADEVDKPTIAVLNLGGNGVSASDLSGLTNRLRAELLKTGKFIVVERDQVDEILREQGFQQTGCTSAECAIEAGQLLGVTKIVLGSVDSVADVYSVNVRLVDVASGRIESTAVDDCPSCGLARVLVTTIRNSARMLAGLQRERQQVSAVLAADRTREFRSECGIPERVWVKFTKSDYPTFPGWTRRRRSISYVVGASAIAVGVVELLLPLLNRSRGETSSSDMAEFIAASVAFDLGGALFILRGARYKKYTNRLAECR